MNDSREWLETDGLGGFAMGAADGIRTRRYHALLLTATTPPTGRMVLVNGVEAWVETAKGSVALSSHHYYPDVIYPDGASRIEQFTADPWPQWRFALDDGLRIGHGIDHVDLKKLGAADGRFHQALYEAAGNPVLLNLIERMWEQFPRYMLWHSPERVRQSIHEHREILQRFSRRDATGTARAVRRHILHGLDAFDAILRAQGAGQSAARQRGVTP